MKSITFKILAVCLIGSPIAGCSNGEDVLSKRSLATTSSAADRVIGGAQAAVPTAATEWAISKDMNVDIRQMDGDLDLAAILGDREIPYPVYPNGSHYRVGDENGLKIIVFETDDAFEEVDSYYQVKAGLPRLSAMKDYVRYSTTKDDQDPWETGKPGIVIHEFDNETERLAVGASDSSRTNIIMSFR